MINNQGFEWFRLGKIKGVGYASLLEIDYLLDLGLINFSDFINFQSIKNSKLSTRLKSKLIASLTPKNEDPIYGDYEDLENNRVQILHSQSADFPIRLKQIGLHLLASTNRLRLESSNGFDRTRLNRRKQTHHNFPQLKFGRPSDRESIRSVRCHITNKNRYNLWI
jgi:hypothetical protein